MKEIFESQKNNVSKINRGQIPNSFTYFWLKNFRQISILRQNSPVGNSGYISISCYMIQSPNPLSFHRSSFIWFIMQKLFTRLNGGNLRIIAYIPKPSNTNEGGDTFSLVQVKRLLLVSDARIYLLRSYIKPFVQHSYAYVKKYLKDKYFYTTIKSS